MSVKQGYIKYLFLSLWYDSTENWTPVSCDIDEHPASRMLYIEQKDLLTYGISGVGDISGWTPVS